MKITDKRQFHKSEWKDIAIGEVFLFCGHVPNSFWMKIKSDDSCNAIRLDNGERGWISNDHLIQKIKSAELMIE